MILKAIAIKKRTFKSNDVKWDFLTTPKGNNETKMVIANINMGIFLRLNGSNMENE